ncbi:MAG: LacI family DNA-binding transcriptional regulator [Pseudomonadota bacterium]
MSEATSKKMRAADRPSIRDVARRAGVSPGCVSNVINGRRRQDDPIGRAVLQAVKDLGYRRNTMASNLRRSQSRIIGLVIPDFENPFFAELVAQLERCAERTNYRIVAASSRENPEIEAREIDELIGWRVAGVLLIPSLKSRTAGLVARSDTPFVMLDRIEPGHIVDAIGVNNSEASGRMVAHLAATGHRRILVAYLGDGLANVAERLDGVRAVAAEAGDRVQVDYLATGGTAEEARAAFTIHLEHNPAPDAVFCLFNIATLAAYGLLQEQGRAITLAGFDDSAWMAHVHPPVSAIVQPVREIAEQAWSRLLSRIEDLEGPKGVLRVACALELRGVLKPETKHKGVPAPAETRVPTEARNTHETAKMEETR